MSVVLLLCGVYGLREKRIHIFGSADHRPRWGFSEREMRSCPFVGDWMVVEVGRSAEILRQWADRPRMTCRGSRRYAQFQE